MKISTMKLADLIKPEKNVRIHTEQQLKEFRRSIKMFGQIRPIVVDENNVILAGNGLYDTLISMGAETADVYKYDNLTENQKKKLMIADNKIFSLGIENLDTLNSFLEDLSDDLDIPGFDEEILKVNFDNELEYALNCAKRKEILKDGFLLEPKENMTLQEWAPFLALSLVLQYYKSFKNLPPIL